MDQIYAFIQMLAAKYPLVLLIISILGSLPVLMSAYVAATPSPEDDKWWNKVKEVPVLGFIIGILERFALISRKP